METITATELQLLECFAVEPKLLDADVPWFYNDALYQCEVEGLEISFAVQPSCRDVRLIVSRGKKCLFELNAVDVADVQVIDEFGVDAVIVLLNERSCLRIQLRPDFEITQEFESATYGGAG
jgi:hypothetical protein